MFDIGLSKLAIIGTVALIVIGPERLPRVARTVGTLMGRAQRYLADVKAEVSREIELDELRRMRDTVQSAAADVENTIHTGLSQTHADIQKAIGVVSDEITGKDAPAAKLAEPPSAAKRKRWRQNVATRQGGTPLWYRQANGRRTRIVSGAARMARYRVRQMAR